MPIPLSNQPSGFFFGNRAANVQIDLFLDIQCPYSAKTWPVAREVMSHFGTQVIGLSVHLLTLSNHRQSWDVTKGLFGLAGTDHGLFFKFADFLYANQARFYNGSFADRTHNDLLKLIAELGQEFDGTDPAKMMTLLNNDKVYYKAKEPGRYAALRGVWSTPTIFINHAEQMSLGSSSTLSDWQAIVDPLLS